MKLNLLQLSRNLDAFYIKKREMIRCLAPKIWKCFSTPRKGKWVGAC